MLKKVWSMTDPGGRVVRRSSHLLKPIRRIRLWFQFFRKGWDDSDTYGIDVTLAKIIIPRLKRFKELNNGFPCNLTEKTWDEILDKMIFAFNKCAKQYDNNEGESTWSKEDKEIIEEGLELFGKYFQDLWW